LSSQQASGTIHITGTLSKAATVTIQGKPATVENPNSCELDSYSWTPSEIALDVADAMQQWLPW
jgi:hypothetical protein